MNTIQTSVHYVVGIELGEVQSLDSDTYTRRITVTDRDGVEVELVLFANASRDDLEIRF